MRAGIKITLGSYPGTNRVRLNTARAARPPEGYPPNLFYFLSACPFQNGAHVGNPRKMAEPE